ncbi:ODFP1 protein, partial [Dasyornis broadbenti]|nr:ODFP1 protein [Dasyornis broadbenti]
SRMKRLAMTLNSCCDDNRLALVDVKGFDPRDVSVTVKDGKVTVSAEHTEEHSTALAKTCNYRKFMKEFSLPPGVDDDEVTCSM